MQLHHVVVAALIVRSQRILLGQRSAERAFYPGVWDLFGGHVEPGEQHDQTLVRELQEELGITPTPWRFLETISLPWGNMILALGVMTFITAALSLLAWPFVIPNVIRLPGPQAIRMQSDATAGVD